MLFWWVRAVSLQWRHNGCDDVSNHQPYHCLLNHLFRRRSKKTSKLRITGLRKCFHLMTSSCFEWFQTCNTEGTQTHMMSPAVDTGSCATWQLLRKLFDLPDIIVKTRMSTGCGVAPSDWQPFVINGTWQLSWCPIFPDASKTHWSWKIGQYKATDSHKWQKPL